jgi:hypothetical protein
MGNKRIIALVQQKLSVNGRGNGSLVKIVAFPPKNASLLFKRRLDSPKRGG